MGGNLRFFQTVVLVVCGSAGCARSHIDGVLLCPALSVATPDGPASYGGLASRGRFARGSCVEVFRGDERIAHTHAGFDGSFALQFLVRGSVSGDSLELRVTDVEGEGTVIRESFVLSDVTEALITYDPGTVPLAAHTGGRIEFNGMLASPSRASTATDDVWLVNWSTGTVADVTPTPPLRARFTASVAGFPGNCASPISGHESGGVGGCWWPQGGGGCTPRCTVEQYLTDTCPPLVWSTCTGERGCAAVEVDERRADVPPPETGERVPVPPPESIPFDGGTDAPILPDTPIDTPIDVPQPDAELM